jgi:inner membrane transporter RhtA
VSELSARPAPGAAPLAQAPGHPALLGGLLLAGIFANTIAASINTHVFLWAAPLAVAWFRQIVAAVTLTGFAGAARTAVPPRSRTWAWAVVWGAALALNTGGFYASVHRIPLGVATTLSFVGPVVVAALGSHRRRDLLWVAFAALGVIAIAHPGGGAFDLPGILMGLASGVGWGVFIVAGGRVVRAWGPTAGAAAATVSAALVLAPFALAQGGFPITNPRATGILVCSASLGAALPYVIDSRVMQRLAPATFSVLQSLFPAVGVIVGIFALDQIPGPLEVAGVALVTVGSVGALVVAGRLQTAPPDASALPLG